LKGTTNINTLLAEFGGRKFTSYPGSFAATNCLWERVYVYLNDYASDAGQQWYSLNNLCYGGTFYYRARRENPIMLAYDNLFDTTTITKGPSSEAFTANYNGYVTNYSRLGTGANDVILTNDPVYQTSWLGRYYYPTDDGMLSKLINVGSQIATNAGLYHFTTMTNQVKETNCTVDIATTMI